MTYLVIGCLSCWHQCDMMPIVSSMAPLHSLGQDDQNKVNMTF